jgi:hypothetical protein
MSAIERGQSKLLHILWMYLCCIEYCDQIFFFIFIFKLCCDSCMFWNTFVKLVLLVVRSFIARLEAI